MARIEIQFELKPDGGLERGYEAAESINCPASSVHAKVEGHVLRVVVNYPENICLNELVDDINARITPDPEGLEFA